MGAKQAFEKSVKKLGSRFRAIYEETSSPCPCEAKGDPFAFEEWHRAHPDAPSCGGSGFIVTERSEDFRAFVTPVDNTEKELTVAGERTVENLVIYWPGFPKIDAAIRIEKLSKDGLVLGVFQASDIDAYEIQGEAVAQTCKLKEIGLQASEGGMGG